VYIAGRQKGTLISLFNENLQAMGTKVHKSQESSLLSVNFIIATLHRLKTLKNSFYTSF
jgi:hypothetical protein